jgi:hypothetical protein
MHAPIMVFNYQKIVSKKLLNGGIRILVYIEQNL